MKAFEFVLGVFLKFLLVAHTPGVVLTTQHKMPSLRRPAAVAIPQALCFASEESSGKITLNGLSAVGYSRHSKRFVLLYRGE